VRCRWRQKVDGCGGKEGQERTNSYVEISQNVLILPSANRLFCGRNDQIFYLPSAKNGATSSTIHSVTSCGIIFCGRNVDIKTSLWHQKAPEEEGPRAGRTVTRLSPADYGSNSIAGAPVRQNQNKRTTTKGGAKKGRHII